MTVDLLSLSEMGSDPKTFYAVAKAPGLLAGMAYPDDVRWPVLHKLGYRHVVCLTHADRHYFQHGLGALRNYTPGNRLSR